MTSQQTTEAPTELSPEDLLRARIALARKASKDDFYYFIQHVFSCSFTEFVEGKFLIDVADHLEESRLTMDVTGRKHFKSTRLYADIMHSMFINDGSGFEAWYFSYAHELAAYHLTKLKNLIKSNPYFAHIKDYKPTANSILDYAWNDNDKHMTVSPSGLLSFKRGIHAERIYVDDPLRDPENKLQPLAIYKINDIMKRELMPMINKGGYCRIVGTPQTNEDFFFDDTMQNRFKTWITRAVVSDNKKQALWPEWMSYEELMIEKETMGESIFNQEYNAMPVYAENSFLDRDKLIPLCTEEAMQFKFFDSLDHKDVVAGFDIGQRVHPSHLSVFVVEESYDEYGNLIKRFRMIYQKWMDGWGYNEQITFLDNAIENFNIKRLMYDDTRGEFKALDEQGRLPSVMIPMSFGGKFKQAAAALLLTAVETERITFIDEPRYINQLLAVTGDLDAMTSKDGHGDSFWSSCLALWEPEASRQKTPRIRSLYD